MGRIRLFPFRAKLSSCIILWLFGGFLALKAQEAPKIPLREVLETLEHTFDVNFTYLDQNVEGVEIAAPPQTEDLKQILAYLRKGTGLDFKILDQKFIAISRSRGVTKTICGYIIDGENGDKVAGAVIHLGTGFTVSDEQGYFQIQEAEEGSILIESLGYQSYNISTNDFVADCPTITLVPEITFLEQLVITNYLTEGINKIPDGAFTINTEALGILPGLIDPDVLQTIQALPGILSANETVSDINVRGGSHDQNLVMWEGIKMYQSGNFFGLISAFNPYLAKEVTLVKNGTRAYLGDGVSSTIDIRTDNDIATKFTGGAGVNLISADAFAHIPISSKLSLQVSGRRSIADIVETPTYQEYFERAFRDTEITNRTGGQVTTDENFIFYDYSLKLLYDPSPKDRIRVNLLNVYDDINYRENAVVSGPEESKTSGLVQKNLAANVSYERQWSERFKTSGLIYLSSYELSAVNFDILNDRRIIQENEVLDTGLKLDASWSVNPQLYWTNGYQFFEIGITNFEDVSSPPFRRRIKNVLRSHALFSELTWDAASGNRHLTLGVRGNYIEELEDFYIEPRISFNQGFGKHFTLELLGEMKSQTTTQVIDFQTDFLGVEKRRWRLSNDSDIPVLENQQLSAGIHYQKNQLLFSVEGYAKKVEGITTSSQGFQNQFESIRAAGNYKIFGIDVLLNRRVGKFNTWGSYSYSESDYKYKDLEPAIFHNNFDIRHTATFGVSYSSSSLEFSLGGNWHTGRPFTTPQQIPVTDGEINFDTPNNSRLEDYLRFDVSATYKFPLSKTVNALLGASIWNFTDRENIINTYYITENDQASMIERSALGFTPNVVFRVRF